MSQALKSSGPNWSLSDPDLLKTQAYINGEWVDADSGAFPDAVFLLARWRLKARARSEWNARKSLPAMNLS